jgi:hypothetical protein
MRRIIGFAIVSAIVCGLFCCARTLHAAEPGSGVVFVQYGVTNQKTNPAWSPVLKDIMNHEAPGDSNHFDDLLTLAHEKTHLIHSHLRILHSNGTAAEAFALLSPHSEFLYRRTRIHPTWKRINAFYVQQDRAVIIEEPNMRKSNVVPFVPSSLRGPRFNLYLVGQTAWDDTPLYIFDEWNAYVNQGVTAVDLVQTGLWHYPWQDGVFGPMEFVAYSVATAMAVKSHDPNYFATNTQFKEFLAFNIVRAMDAFRKGSVMPAFKYDAQDAFYRKMCTAPDAAAFRTFATQMFGTEWTARVLGF